ncbi:MAG: hypothetical protein ABH896_00610 [Candidatus Jacksonbacteria bacterium]
MQRTQVYLPYNILEQVKEIAYNEEASMASIIRKIIGQGLSKKKLRQKKDICNLLKELSVKGNKNTPTDLSANHDKYLYGYEHN